LTVSLGYSYSTHPVVSPLPERHTEPLPVLEFLLQGEDHGRDAGRVEALQLLDQARQNGEPLTEQEVANVYAQQNAFMLRLAEAEEAKHNGTSRDWLHGWFQGFVDEFVQAKKHAVAPVVTRTVVKFRQALIDVDNAEEFESGIVCGQASQVDEDSHITAEGILHEFACEINNTDEDDDVPLSFRVGFLLGRVDALLRARKTYPPTY
jgi:hypothetical protein